MNSFHSPSAVVMIATAIVVMFMVVQASFPRAEGIFERTPEFRPALHFVIGQ
jgi:hypothetical protein